MTDSENVCGAVGGDSQVSLADIMKEIREMSATIKVMKETIDSLHGENHQLRVENDHLRQELAAVKKRDDDLRRMVTEAKFQATLGDRRSNDLEQYGRRNNIRVFGISEENGESASKSEEKVLGILCEKMGLKVSSQQVEAAHRVGRRPESPSDPPRPIIVRFLNRKTVAEVFAQKKKLHGTGYRIVEDLTKTNYQLLQQCKHHPDCETAWSLRGKIFAKRADGKVLEVRPGDDVVGKLFNEDPARSREFRTSTPARRTRLQRVREGRGRIAYSTVAAVNNHRGGGHSGAREVPDIETGTIADDSDNLTAALIEQSEQTKRKNAVP